MAQRKDDEVAFRPATPADAPVLRGMLWLAVHWRDATGDRGRWPEPDAPRRYVEGFGRPGDGGVVAERGGRGVGAAWYRRLPAGDAGYGYVANDVPELSLAVEPGARGRGIGGELLRRALAAADAAGERAVSLSVEPENPARRLYERHGFARVGGSGGTWTLVRRLGPEPDCVVVRGGRAYGGAQGLEYFEGISAQSAGATGLCLHLLTIPPGGAARPHLHEHHESAVYVLSGTAEMRFGEGLARRVTVGAGDFLYIPAGMPHRPANLSGSEPCRAVVARTDPDEQESVVLLDEEGRRPPR